VANLSLGDFLVTAYVGNHGSVVYTDRNLPTLLSPAYFALGSCQIFTFIFVFKKIIYIPFIFTFQKTKLKFFFTLIFFTLIFFISF
jgi:hypothetical protein